MMPSQPNWTPVPQAPASQDDVPACQRCLHRASAHHDPASCAGRGRWGRRCTCRGYLRPDHAAPPAEPR